MKTKPVLWWVSRSYIGQVNWIRTGQLNCFSKCSIVTRSHSVNYAKELLLHSRPVITGSFFVVWSGRRRATS